MNMEFLREIHFSLDKVDIFRMMFQDFLKNERETGNEWKKYNKQKNKGKKFSLLLKNGINYGVVFTYLMGKSVKLSSPTRER